MKIDTHSVVYFINEEYGVVIKANGATKEVAMWEKKRGGFTQRIDLLTASFLARVNRIGGKWCAAHPTYSRSAAIKVAQMMTPSLPNAEGMRRARQAKQMAMRAELHEKGAERMMTEIAQNWQKNEANYAEM